MAYYGAALLDEEVPTPDRVLPIIVGEVPIESRKEEFMDVC
jgi:hypothetical protein